MSSAYRIFGLLTLFGGGLALTACGGGGGSGAEENNGSGDQGAPETATAEVIAFGRSDSDVLAIANSSEPNEPDLVVLRSDSSLDAYDLHLLYPDGARAVATTGSENRVNTLLYTESDKVTNHRFEFSSYNDASGEVVVTYTPPSGPPITELVLSGGAEDEDGTSGDNDSTAGDLTGSWLVSERVVTDSCGEEIGQTYTETIGIEQSGSNISVTTSSGKFDGSLDGQNIQWSGSYPEDGGTTSSSLDASVNEAFSEITGSTRYSFELSDGSFTCDGTTEFSATLVGGTAMATVAAQDVDLLDEKLDEALRTLSDPFETYLPLNLYKQAGEIVEDLAEAAKNHFNQVRETVQQGGNTLRSLGNGLSCLVGTNQCAEVAAEDAGKLVKDVDRIDPQGEVTAGFRITEEEILPVRAEWDPLVESGEIDVSFNVTETPCEESVFATMNPNCPQYEAPGDGNDGGDGTTGDNDSGGDGGSGGDGNTDGGGGVTGAPTASSNFIWESPWGTDEDIVLPPAQGAGWMESVMNECTWFPSSGIVNCFYPDRITDDEYSVDNRSVQFSDFTADPNEGGVPRDATFYRRCNLYNESCQDIRDTQYMTVEWANDGSLMRVRNTRGEQTFVNDLRRWDVDGRPVGLSVFASPYTPSVDGTRNQTSTECDYFSDGIQVQVTERVWVNANQLSSPDSTETSVGESCPIPDGFQGYEDQRPDVAAKLQ